MRVVNRGHDGRTYVHYSDRPIKHPEERGTAIHLHYACNGDFRARTPFWQEVAAMMMIEVTDD